MRAHIVRKDRKASRSLLEATAAAAAATAAAATTATFTASSAHAGIMLDLRAVAVNGQPLAPGDTSKLVRVNYGDEINLKLYAVVSGTNGVNDEQLQIAFGNIVSGQGTADHDVFGALAGGVLAPFNGTAHQNGSQVDLDQDGDIDIGAPVGSSGTAAMGYFNARSNTPTSLTHILDANTSEIEIGQFNFATQGGTTDTWLNFVRRTNFSGANITTAAVWFEDGVARNPTTSSYAAGAPIMVFIPEPAGVAAVVGAAALGLLARRRTGANA